MIIKNSEDLRKIKEKFNAEKQARLEKESQIIIGMGTCGLAAGARAIAEAVSEELARHNLHNVSIVQTGCIGMCQKEPLLDVVRPGEPRITYGNVKPEDVPRIISEHLIGGNVLGDLVIAKL